jgi:predicted nucleic acid-binding protein
VRRVAVDANVFVSFFIDRHTGQHAAARALIQQAEDGEIVGVVPQSVVFEVAYVLQTSRLFRASEMHTNHCTTS